MANIAASRSGSEGASQDLLNVFSSAFRRIGALEIDQGILAQAGPSFSQPFAHFKFSDIRVKLLKKLLWV